MKTVGVRGRLLRVVLDTAIDKGVADIIADVMAEKSCQISNALFPLLAGRYRREML